MSRELIIKTILGFYPDVQAIYLFGTYLTEHETKESDADIALLLPVDKAKEAGGLALGECHLKLEEVLGRTVDLINIRRVNTVFQCEILRDGGVIYVQNENAVDEFEMLAISFYQKLNEERAGIVEEILATGRIVG